MQINLKAAADDRCVKICGLLTTKVTTYGVDYNQRHTTNSTDLRNKVKNQVY